METYKLTNKSESESLPGNARGVRWTNGGEPRALVRDRSKLRASRGGRRLPPRNTITALFWQLITGRVWPKRVVKHFVQSTGR